MKIIWAILFFLAGFLLAVVWFSTTSISAWNFVTANPDASAIAFTGVVGATVAMWGVLSQRAIMRRQVTVEYIDRQARDRDYIEARKHFVNYAQTPLGVALYAGIEYESSDEINYIFSVLNDLELISIGMQRGIIDFEIYKMYRKTTVVRYWGYADKFIAQIRARTGQDMLFHEFESMAGWFKGTKKPKRRYLIGQWIK